MNAEILIELVTFKMPFGKYKDVIIADLPEFYLVWYSNKGFPKGKLGTLLHTMYEIKLNGLEYLLKPFKEINLSFFINYLPLQREPGINYFFIIIRCSSILCNTSLPLS